MDADDILLVGSGAARQHRRQRRQQQDRAEERGGDADADDIAQVAEGRRFGEVQTEEADDRRDAGEKDRLEVDLHGLGDRLSAGRSLPHLVQHGAEDVHAVGDRQREDQAGTADRGGSQWNAQPTRQSYSHDHRQGDHHQGGQHAEERPQCQSDQDRHRYEHRRRQRGKVALTGLAEGLIDHDRASHIEIDLRISILDVFQYVRSGPSHLRRRLAILRGHGQPDENPCHVPRRADDAVEDCPFRERHLPSLFDLGIAHLVRIRNQILDDQVLSLAPGVLKVRYRADSGRIGDVPSRFGQLGNGAKRGPREDVAVFGGDDEQDVLLFAERVFQGLERLVLGILLAEEGARVAIDAQIANAQCGQTDHRHRQQNDPPAIPDHPLPYAILDPCHIASCSVNEAPAAASAATHTVFMRVTL